MWQYFSIRIFILFFILFFSFSSTFPFIFSFFFFLFFSSTQMSSPLLFIFFFISSRTFQPLCFTSKRREREERSACRPLAAPAAALALLQHLHRRWVRSACSFFSFSFFSYMLVLIQLYFKNWILFCVWINYFAHE